VRALFSFFQEYIGKDAQRVPSEDMAGKQGAAGAPSSTAKTAGASASAASSAGNSGNAGIAPAGTAGGHEKTPAGQFSGRSQRLKHKTQATKALSRT